MSAGIGMISLGCAKNQVNAEQMLYLLSGAGYTVLPGPKGADVVIINTCGFIESAKQEAIDNIIAVGAMKEQGLVGKLLVTGCLSQRYQKEILEELPEVDGVLGTGNYADIVESVERLLKGEQVCSFASIDDDRIDGVGRVLTTPEHYAYLKIAEGCDNHCAYCVIPSLRGKFRSRPMEDLIREAEQFAENGVRELIVVAQDTTRYGKDLYGTYRLAELLRKLCRIEKLDWIRVHYMYSDEITDELIDVFAQEEKIVKYMDIPIQHVNDAILKRMHRRDTRKIIEQLFTKLRTRIPGLVLRTSLITGLPGEGEEEFTELCEFLKEHKLERVGAFAFSPEEGTPAAEMERPDAETAARRAEIVCELQSRIMDEYNELRIGEVLRVLCESFDAERGEYYGRSYADSPEIDGCVRFTAVRPIPTGTFVTVLVDDVTDGDLSGTVVEVEKK